jgi:imidazolonepropionase-like amidohydrolase
MVKAIVDSGGHVMAGSDAPGGLMGYGWSLHRELVMLVDAGLSPMQALAAATRVPATWLGAERDWGTLKRGLRADLVLLDADPLADIRNTSNIRAISIGGHWLERRELDDLTEKARIRLRP